MTLKVGTDPPLFPFGARPTRGGVAFAVWAPLAERVELILENPERRLDLASDGDGGFSGEVVRLLPGARYRYRIDGAESCPDPASRYQPEGVHGPSEVIDPWRFEWSDEGWGGVGLDELVVYELHVGTFSPEGTFTGAAQKLRDLRDLGVTAVELMPVADFAGDRGWGYDGVAWFAPARCYGSPDDLRRFVDVAHGLGLAVLLDVVYNHLGPDGAYLRTVSPPFFSDRHSTPWGDAVNLDGAQSRRVREFLITNAVHWVREYHVDGLRLDATHALFDESPVPILADIGAAARAAAPERRVLVIAEDHRNLAALVRPAEDGGLGLDAVWADDFHHQIRRAVAGDHEGYFRDFTGSTADIATTLAKGWFYCGHFAEGFGGPRGTEPEGLARRQAVICLQNHDQIGNRALGDRLHHAVDLPTYHAACVLLLMAPETPLLFMGQEWAASSPFLYFTDHDPKLGRLVTEGRRREFSSFAAFRDSASRELIPDPQALSTFERSRLHWEERSDEPHASTLRLYRELLALRATLPREEEGFRAFAQGRDAVCMRRGNGDRAVFVVARLRGSGDVWIPPDEVPSGLAPEAAFDTETHVDPSQRIAFRLHDGGIVVSFTRAAALVLRSKRRP